MPTARSRAPSRMWSSASVASRTGTSSILLNEEASTCSQTNAAKHPADIVIHLRRFISGRIGRSHRQRQSGNRFASNLWETTGLGKDPDEAAAVIHHISDPLVKVLVLVAVTGM